MTSWFLSTVHPGFLMIGLCILVIGIGLLYRAWQQPKRQLSLVGLGWAALLLVHWPLGVALGFDRGWAVAAILPGFIALLWLAVITPWAQWNLASPRKRMSISAEADARASRITGPASVHISRSQAFQLMGQILVVGLLSFAAALGVGAALFSLLDGSIANRTVYAALAVVVVWPMLMVWSKAAASVKKPAACFVGIALGGLLLTPLFY